LKKSGNADVADLEGRCGGQQLFAESFPELSPSMKEPFETSVIRGYMDHHQGFRPTPASLFRATFFRAIALNDLALVGATLSLAADQGHSVHSLLGNCLPHQFGQRKDPSCAVASAASSVSALSSSSTGPAHAAAFPVVLPVEALAFPSCATTWLDTHEGSVVATEGSSRLGAAAASRLPVLLVRRCTNGVDAVFTDASFDAQVMARDDLEAAFVRAGGLFTPLAFMHPADITPWSHFVGATWNFLNVRIFGDGDGPGHGHGPGCDQHCRRHFTGLRLRLRKTVGAAPEANGVTSAVGSTCAAPGGELAGQPSWGLLNGCMQTIVRDCPYEDHVTYTIIRGKFVTPASPSTSVVAAEFLTDDNGDDENAEGASAAAFNALDEAPSVFTWSKSDPEVDPVLGDVFDESWDCSAFSAADEDKGDDDDDDNGREAASLFAAAGASDYALDEDSSDYYLI
jgi:hypothetical protein